MSNLKTLREKLAERLISGGALDEIVAVALDDYLQSNLRAMQDLLLEKLVWNKANKEDFWSYGSSARACITLLRDYTISRGYKKEEEELVSMINKGLDKL